MIILRLEMLKALNINVDDGVVRLSLTHYNSAEESKMLIDALKNINYNLV